MRKDARRAQCRHAFRCDVAKVWREDRDIEFAGQPMGILRGSGGDLNAGWRTVGQPVRPGSGLEGEAAGDFCSSEYRPQQPGVAAAAVRAGDGGRRELPHTTLPCREQPPKLAQACGHDTCLCAYPSGAKESVKLGGRDEISACQLQFRKDRCKRRRNRSCQCSPPSIQIRYKPASMDTILQFDDEVSGGTLLYQNQIQKWVV
jgi:hypothetical protein